MNELNLLIGIVQIVFGLLVLIYILGVIPKRIKRANDVLDTVTKNQTIIEKLIKKLGGVK